MSTSVLKALPGKLDIKRHSPSILYLLLLQQKNDEVPKFAERLEEANEDRKVRNTPGKQSTSRTSSAPIDLHLTCKNQSSVVKFLRLYYRDFPTFLKLGPRRC